ncbi:TetR/AcrR family transcriptional regulator [Kitasatospora sp. DSM 101779]|uniref:TetR/AcrR family transcriptional regulator n=1 Tax=Kitasatospora sp. DSM 101779 TaxID=2853165 RepID=UPI0021D938B0|nr:TetR/AcrR family transcriptional regulator [Kitasatospora sp. DSM 101779]
MTDQERLAGGVVSPVHGRIGAGHGSVPEQRGPVGPELVVAGPGTGRPGRLRVDARRNLESVLRAARQVFGELGYDAPMEEVARRAGVGVGTVYRRFPSKEVLVRRIAAEEVAWLTAQARESLYGGGAAWESLAGFLGRAVASGAGRLLPPEAFRYAAELGRVPEQRGSEAEAEPSDGARPGAADADPRLLLQLVAALVARAAAAGELRPGVTVSDVVLVLTAAVPVHAVAAVTDDAESTDGQLGDVPAQRLLRILLQGLQAH